MGKDMTCISSTSQIWLLFIGTQIRLPLGHQPTLNRDTNTTSPPTHRTDRDDYCWPTLNTTSNNPPIHHTARTFGIPNHTGYRYYKTTHPSHRRLLLGAYGVSSILIYGLMYMFFYSFVDRIIPSIILINALLKYVILDQ